MPEPDIDLERAVSDPVYRRQVIEQLKAESGDATPKGVEQVHEGRQELKAPD